MSIRNKSKALYAHPFSKAYWMDALSELKDIRMVTVCALMIALRVAMKGLGIPIAPTLKINIAFVINALGAMIFGPVVAALGACVSDVLGFLCWPQNGIYFVPYMFVEVAGSVIFALFLYRAKLTPGRAILSRFCIDMLVNIGMNIPISMLYYRMVLGYDMKTLVIIQSVVKNICMFPIESWILTVFLSLMVPITYRLKLTYDGGADRSNLRFSKKQIALLAVLLAIGIGGTLLYLPYYYDTTSMSASYEAQERYEINCQMNDNVLAQTDDWDDETTVSVVESAYKKFAKGYTTYNVAVYTVDEDALAATKNTLDDLRGYSKSKAAKDETMTRQATAVIVVKNKTGEVLEFSITPEE